MLLKLGTGGRYQRWLPNTGIAMARSHSLLVRLRSILDERRARQGTSRPVQMATGCLAILLIVPLSQLTQALPVASRPASPKPEAQQTPSQSRSSAASAQQQQPSTPVRPDTHEEILVTLPDGQMLKDSPQREALITHALSLLRSTEALGSATGSRDSSVQFLFTPPCEVSLPGGGSPAQPQTVHVRRLYIDVANPLGPGDIVVETDTGMQSFARALIQDWVAFRRVYDHLLLARLHPSVPAAGKQSGPVDGMELDRTVSRLYQAEVGKRSSILRR